MKIIRMHQFVEDTYEDLGVRVETPLRKVAVVAVVKNPYAGKVQQDLSYLIEESKKIGKVMADKAVELMGDLPVESYGKGAVIGLDGEQEHGVALLTSTFGNVLREAVGGGKAWISSMTKRASAGETIDIPLAFKDEVYVRSHYDGITIKLPDSPHPDEIAIICTLANRGRLNPRVGGTTKEEALQNLSE